MRAGEVNLNNSVFEGASILISKSHRTTHCKPSGSGVQLLVWQHLSAHCRIRQQGVLIHSILVPAGAFHLLMYLFAMVIVISCHRCRADGSSHDYIVFLTLFNQHVKASRLSAIGRSRR